MRFLLEIGYYKILLQEGIDASELLKALEGAVQISSEGWGNDAKYTLSDQIESVSLTIIYDKQITNLLTYRD